MNHTCQELGVENCLACAEDPLDMSKLLPDPLHPSDSVLMKLGSAIVHVAEYLSEDGHGFDLVSFRLCLEDREVKEWLGQMTDLALITVKRRA